MRGALIHVFLKIVSGYIQHQIHQALTGIKKEKTLSPCLCENSAAIDHYETAADQIFSYS